MSSFTQYIHFMIALIAIVDVPGNVPIFLKRTEKFTLAGKSVAAISAAIATALILMFFALLGEGLLSVFGITIDAFRILGGIVILLMALEMLGLRVDPSVTHGGHSENPISIGVFPMAVPLFAGPGAISAVMVFAHYDPSADFSDVLAHEAMMAVVILTVGILVLVGLLLASALARLITPLVQDIMNRLLGVIVGALGVEFILEGVAGFFPVFGGT